jgi:hypothetical protein
MAKTVSKEEEAFLRQFVIPEEYLQAMRWRVPWRGEFRRFQSSNVVCLESYRRPTPVPASQPALKR